MHNINMIDYYDHNLKIESESHNLSIFLNWPLSISFSTIHCFLIIDY